jgi:hypothetical protein
MPDNDYSSDKYLPELDDAKELPSLKQLRSEEAGSFKRKKKTEYIAEHFCS